MKKIIVMLLLLTGFVVYSKAQDTTRVKKTPDERAAQMGKMMAKKLNLTADQSKQVDAILTDRAEKMAAMKGTKGNRAAKMKLMADSDNQIEALLTDAQKKEYAVMKENAKEKIKENRMSNVAPATPPANTTPPPAQ
jgi:protein CpxP